MKYVLFFSQRKLELERERQRRKEERLQKKEQRRREREERRRQKLLEQQQREEEERMQLKIALEERRLLIAQRKLESLRVLSELFERVKVCWYDTNCSSRQKSGVIQCLAEVKYILVTLNRDI